MSKTDNLYRKSVAYMNMLCVEITERCVGSPGNREATRFFEQELASLGWKTESPTFDVLDWRDRGAFLKAGGTDFTVFASPYSPGCSVMAQLVSATNIAGLSRLEAKGKIIFLHGEIAREQLMPKNFIFYNPEEHQKIIALLEKSGARAIICATGKNAPLAGAVNPFPLIEDGDFTVSSVYMTEAEGSRLIPFIGEEVFLQANCERFPAKGCNVIGRRGGGGAERIVFTAHIDAKKGTPGAIDNAAGVAVLLLLAGLLRDYQGDRRLEIVAFNGEDYYCTPGQIKYIEANRENFGEVLVNINIDGAGYRHGETALSFYNLPEYMVKPAREMLERYTGLTEGAQWPQGDHAVFLQYGRPAVAATSKWLADNAAVQDITHTPKDNTGIVDCRKLVELAEAVNSFARKI